MVTVTGVVVAPAAIAAGLNTHAAPGSPLVNAGRPPHEKLTAEPNDAPPGTAENV